MVIKTQSEQIICRIQFIRITKTAATQVACAGNARGHYLENENSWFNNRENDGAYCKFQSYSKCSYSSSEQVTDEEEED